MFTPVRGQNSDFRLESVKSFKDALQQAKLGEAYGYRSLSATAPMVAAVQPAESNTNQGHNQHLFSMLHDISHRLEKLEAPTSRPWTGHDRDLPTCHACGGAGHLKRSCNWTGHARFPKVSSKVPDMFPDRTYRRGMSSVRYKENSP